MKHPKHYDTDEKTSRRMANVKLKGGTEESVLAKRLWKEGYRYWLNYKKLPGSPDIAIKKFHIAIFVDGEFWHGYDWENKKPRLKRNREYWVEKIEENMARDTAVDKDLRRIGWIPIHFWTNEVRENLEECLQTIREVTLEYRIQSMDGKMPYEVQSKENRHGNIQDSC